MNRLQPSNGTAALDYSESPDTRIEGTPRYQHSGTRHTFTRIEKAQSLSLSTTLAVDDGGALLVVLLL